MTHGNGALILMYHRIANADRDPQLLCVSPDNFQGHLELLRGSGAKIMPLGELAAAAEQGRVPDGAVAITFDDGYSDNLEYAAPLLRAYDAPATVFATTAHTNCDAEFYWDDLDRIFLSAGALPRYLRLWMADSAIEIDLGDYDYYAHSQARANREWTVLAKADPTPRHRAYRQLCEALHGAPVSLRRDALNQLQTWSGLPTRRSRRMLSVDEIRALATGGLIDVGGHTVDHPLLSIEDEASQREQILDNRDALAWVLGHQPRAFAYPYGTRRDYTAATINIVKRAGYGYACANFGGCVTASSNPLQLPRHVVRDWSADQLEERLDAWFAAPIQAAAPLSKAG